MMFLLQGITDEFVSDPWKRAAPLEWKIGFHEYKVLPQYYRDAREKPARWRAVDSSSSMLIYLVAGHRNPQQFLETGRATNYTIRRTLQKHNLVVDQFGSVLDFGCGVGRIMRHWRTTKGPAWHGTDYIPRSSIGAEAIFRSLSFASTSSPENCHTNPRLSISSTRSQCLRT